MNSLWVVYDFVISPTDCRTFSGFSRIFKVILLYLMLGYAENKHCKPASAVLCCFQVSCRRNRIFPVSIAFDRIAEARRHHFSQKDQKGNRRNRLVHSCGSLEKKSCEMGTISLQWQLPSNILVAKVSLRSFRSCIGQMSRILTGSGRKVWLPQLPV